MQLSLNKSAPEAMDVLSVTNAQAVAPEESDVYHEPHESEVLIHAFKKGEEWAYSKLYRRYRKAILKYVFQNVADKEVAEDLSQEIFLKAYRFRESYQSRYAFSTWLWTISRNTIFDWFRKDKEKSQCERSTDGVSSSEIETPCLRPNAEAVLAQQGDKKVLLKVFDKLTALQQKVLHMRLIHRFSYQEIARKLGLSLSSVKCLVYRSKRVLGQEMVSGTESPEVA